MASEGGWWNAIPLVGNIVDNIVGADNSNKDRQAQQGMAQDNIVAQREFAQHGLRWKVEDAKRAGIAPLAALGAQTHSFSPVSIGSSGEHTPTNFGEMGQNLTRAINGTRTAEEQELAKIQLASARTDLDGKALDNQIKASQLKQMQSGPPFPGSEYILDGQANSGVIRNKPLERTFTRPGKPHQEVGSVSDVGYADTQFGKVPVPSSDIKQKIEDNMIQEVMWAIRNNILPNSPFHPGDPPDSDHKWDPTTQSYRKNSYYNYWEKRSPYGRR